MQYAYFTRLDLDLCFVLLLVIYLAKFNDFLSLNKTFSTFLKVVLIIEMNSADGSGGAANILVRFQFYLYESSRISAPPPPSPPQFHKSMS